MPRVAYISKRFNRSSRAIITHAEQIIGEYMADGYSLTLRQLYYQFVARGLIPNNMRSYKRLGNVINDARLAGLIDWHAIEDRTRNLRSLPHWNHPKDILKSAAEQFAFDKWADQPHRVEVWVEKDALLGVIERACDELDVPFFACRGYTSQSEQWRAAQRFREHKRNGQQVVVLHLGDHDPSGIDMTRDNSSRLEMFMSYADVQRIALNWDQVEEHSPPPNPAKITDSRFEAYRDKHGEESWELDALDPKVIHQLITKHVLKFRDDELWEKAFQREKRARSGLKKVAETYGKRKTQKRS